MPRRSLVAETQPNLRRDNTIRLAARCEGAFLLSHGLGSLVRIGVHQASSGIFGDHRGGLLADYDRWCVGAGIQCDGWDRRDVSREYQ